MTLQPRPLWSILDGEHMGRRDRVINFIFRLPSALRMRVRVVLFRAAGMRLGRRCWLQDVFVPRNPWDVQLGDHVALDRHVVLLTIGDRKPDATSRIVIGGGTYVNRFTMFDASESIEVGENTMIGPFCYITDHDHGQNPASNISSQGYVSRPVKIGKDVWIGAGVVILKGVEIGDGAVIAAGSIVNKNVSAMSKVAGVPARSIGVRQ